MTEVLQIPARPGAPIACDMTTARDTPGERLKEYRRLFDAALVRRARDADTVTLVFRADEGIRDAVDDLARREAACCPFVDYRIETIGDDVRWTITNPVAGEQRASANVMLDAFYSLPEDAGVDVDEWFGKLAERGVQVMEPEPRRFAFRA
jgi:hypothetical protein